jgi:hypothetical protein
VVIASWAEAAAAHAKGELPGVLRAGLRETWALPEVAITTFDGHLCVAERLLYGGQPYDEVIAFADALEAEAERLGAARGRAFATTFRGEARLLTGDLAGASADLDRGVALHRAIGASGGASLGLERLAQIACTVATGPAPSRLLDDALVAARDSGSASTCSTGSTAPGSPSLPTPPRRWPPSRRRRRPCRVRWRPARAAASRWPVPAALAAADAGDLQRALRYESVAEELTTLLMRLPGWYAALDEVRGHRARAEGRRAGSRPSPARRRPSASARSASRWTATAAPRDAALLG